MFNAWRNGEMPPAEAGAKPLDRLLSLANAAHPIFQVDDADPLVHFYIENSCPETRHLVHVPHVVKQRNTITASLCVLVSSKDGHTQSLVHKTSTIIKLDVGLLMGDLVRYLSGLFKWNVAHVTTSVQRRPAIMDAPRVPVLINPPAESDTATPDDLAIVPFAQHDDGNQFHTSSAVAFLLSQLRFCFK